MGWVGDLLASHQLVSILVLVVACGGPYCPPSLPPPPLRRLLASHFVDSRLLLCLLVCMFAHRFVCGCVLVVCLLFCWLVGRLVGWLVGCLVGRLVVAPHRLCSGAL